MWKNILLTLFNIFVISSAKNSYHELLKNVHTLPRNIQSVRSSVEVLTDALPAEFSPLRNVYTETLSSTRNVTSELCINQTSALFDGLIRRQIWAIRMLDATGKPGTAILDGNIVWLGDYDECLTVQSNLSDNLVSVQPFKGEYCLVNVNLPGTKQNDPSQMNPAAGYLRLGVCLPDSCTENDAVTLVNLGLSAVHRFINGTQNLSAVSATCQEPEKKFDTRAVIVMVVVSIFMTVMVVATLFDILYIQWPKSNRESMSAVLNGEVQEGYNHKIFADEETPLIADKVIQEYKPGIPGQMLLSFSVYTNAAKILGTNQGAGSLTAVNGIRFISMTWVILGHTYVFFISAGDNLLPFYAQMLKRWSFGAILNALVSVDSFFTLSGLLLTYLTLKELKRRDGKLNWFLFYFHRVWRLTPPYMLILLTYVSLLEYVGDGPMWPKNGVEYNHCKSGWFYNILYINNFINFKDQSLLCMGWTWYLANDMQFFIISPLILIPLFYSRLIGSIVMLIFLLGTWITTGVISNTYSLSTSLFGGGTDIVPYFSYYYVKPYCRFGPYLVGMFTGYLLYRTNCKCRINRYINLFLWVVAATLAILILYGLHGDVNGHPMSKDVAALYNTVHRTVWGACICWVIFACATGNGGWVNTFLSWKAFIPLSRLTYCAYLVHPIVMYYITGSLRRLIHFSDNVIIYYFLTNLCLSYAAAFVASLAYESPMMGLEKVIFRRGTKKD